MQREFPLALALNLSDKQRRSRTAIGQLRLDNAFVLIEGHPPIILAPAVIRVPSLPIEKAHASQKDDDYAFGISHSVLEVSCPSVGVYCMSKASHSKQSEKTAFIIPAGTAMVRTVSYI